MNNENFLKEIRNIVQLLFKDEQKAKCLFNNDTYPKYFELIHTEIFDEDSMFLFMSVDNYFNNESMKILKVAPNKQDLLAEYQEVVNHSLFEESIPVYYIPDRRDN